LEIRTGKDKEKPQLWPKEENDLMSVVASILLNHPSPEGWVHAAEVHVQVCYARLYFFVQFLEF
jgi:hypothetical protein